MSTPLFQIRSVYSFDVYPIPILGNNFKNVTVLAVMDFETANREFDAVSQHINLYPYLPSGSPNKPDGYDYVKIKTTAGIITILGIAWIKAESIQLVESRTAQVTIGDITASDLARIRNALVSNGFNNLKIEIN